MPTYIELSAMAATLRAELPDSYQWPDGSTSGIYYAADEDGEDYAVVGYNLPDGIYAEIDSGTYGTLQGFRVYL